MLTGRRLDGQGGSGTSDGDQSLTGRQSTTTTARQDVATWVEKKQGTNKIAQPEHSELLIAQAQAYMGVSLRARGGPVGSGGAGSPLAVKRRQMKKKEKKKKKVPTRYARPLLCGARSLACFAWRQVRALASPLAGNGHGRLFLGVVSAPVSWQALVRRRGHH
jgi:hypothetical protein